MIEITIPFEHLTSKNSKYVLWGGRPRLSDEYKDGKEAINFIAKSQYKGKIIDSPVSVTMTFYMPDGYRRDVLNYTQQLCDGLEDAIYTNDWYIVEAIVRRAEIDRDNPRVEILVKEINK